jgi:hypothetical protein
LDDFEVTMLILRIVLILVAISHGLLTGFFQRIFLKKRLGSTGGWMILTILSAALPMLFLVWVPFEQFRDEIAAMVYVGFLILLELGLPALVNGMTMRRLLAEQAARQNSASASVPS